MPRADRDNSAQGWSEPRPLRRAALLWLERLAWLAGVAALAWLVRDRWPEPVARGGGPAIARSESAEAVLESARIYVNRGETARARAVLEAATAEFPRDQDLRLALAELLAQAGAYEAALDAQLAAAEIGPADGPVLLGAGRLAAVLERTSEAAALYERACEADPVLAEAWVRLARARLTLDDLDGAEAALDRAASLDPAAALVWGMRAEVALRAGRPEEAARLAARAGAIDPSEGAWRVIEARARRSLGDEAGAARLEAAAGG